MTTRRYSFWAIVLHWAIAALLLFQISLGWRLEDLPKGVAEFQGFQLHKSVGIAILLLSVARLLIRFALPCPARAPDSPAMQKLAGAVHWLLYGVMIVGPLTGWVLVSTARVKMQTMLFGLVPWPNLPVGHVLHEPSEVIHGALGWVGLGLIALHVAGAVRHHLQGEDLVYRMLPITSRKGLTAGLGIAVAGIVAAMVAAQVWPFGASATVVPVPEASASQSAVAADPAASATPSESPAADVSAAASEPAQALGAADWKVEKGGRLGFKAEYSGEAVNGTFSRWDAAIRFSPDDLAHSSIKVTIDLASVSTADGQRDEMLKSDSFFGVATHPQAVFTSSHFIARANGAYTAAGTLTLNGHARPLTLAFRLAIKGDRADASGSTTLQRSSFGVGSGEWAGTDSLKDAVAVDFALKAARAPQPAG